MTCLIRLEHSTIVLTAAIRCCFFIENRNCSFDYNHDFVVSCFQKRQANDSINIYVTKCSHERALADYVIQIDLMVADLTFFMFSLSFPSSSWKYFDNHFNPTLHRFDGNVARKIEQICHEIKAERVGNTTHLNYKAPHFKCCRN